MARSTQSEFKSNPMFRKGEPSDIPCFGLGFEMRDLVERSRRMVLEPSVCMKHKPHVSKPVESDS